jgi:hypothetical protein
VLRECRAGRHSCSARVLWPDSVACRPVRYRQAYVSFLVDGDVWCITAMQNLLLLQEQRSTFSRVLRLHRLCATCRLPWLLACASAWASRLGGTEMCALQLCGGAACGRIGSRWRSVVHLPRGAQKQSAGGVMGRKVPQARAEPIYRNFSAQAALAAPREARVGARCSLPQGASSWRLLCECNNGACVVLCMCSASLRVFLFVIRRWAWCGAHSGTCATHAVSTGRITCPPLCPTVFA